MNADLNSRHTVLFIASEMGGIARAGGLGDVVRDLSVSLQEAGIDVAVVLPAYGDSRKLGQPVASLKTPFGLKTYKTEILLLTHLGVPVYQIRNKTFFEKENSPVYIDSGRLGRGPFEDDARRFAFFSAATAEALRVFPPFREIEIIHCHDWHTGVFLSLLRLDPRNKEINARVRSLFTIHNMGYQGIRPFVYAKEKELMSFQSWFPALYRSLVATPRLFDIRDPRTSDPCFNPLKAGIRLADLTTTVSPTYAHEITLPDDPGNRFTGGNGLERDIALLARQGRLSGIRNGIDYETMDPAKLQPPIKAGNGKRTKQKNEFKIVFLKQLAKRFSTTPPGRDWASWKKRPLGIFISRAVDQKAGILFERQQDGRAVLEALLERDISLIALSAGELEDEFAAVMQRDNALFINEFDPDLATALYAAGDFLLLPSYFEPCGISQLIAMRYGCLPLVHEIGGLLDTVANGKTGFAYAGINLDKQKRGLLRTLDRLLKTKTDNPDRWEEMIQNAMKERFTWEEPTRIYRQLYGQLLGRPVGDAPLS